MSEYYYVLLLLLYIYIYINIYLYVCVGDGCEDEEEEDSIVGRKAVVAIPAVKLSSGSSNLVNNGVWMVLESGWIVGKVVDGLIYREK